MSNPMLSSWYPTDPFLYPPTERIELFVIKKYTVSKMRGIGRNEPRDLPDIRPLFPNGCTDMLYRGRGRLDLVCLLGKPIKPWNPADPCLKLAAEIYYNEDDDISKFFTEQNRIAALDLAQALRRIESGDWRVELDAIFRLEFVRRLVMKRQTLKLLTMKNTMQTDQKNCVSVKMKLAPKTETGFG